MELQEVLKPLQMILKYLSFLMLLCLNPMILGKCCTATSMKFVDCLSWELNICTAISTTAECKQIGHLTVLIRCTVLWHFYDTALRKSTFLCAKNKLQTKAFSVALGLWLFFTQTPIVFCFVYNMQALF